MLNKKVKQSCQGLFSDSPIHPSMDEVKVGLCVCGPHMSVEQKSESIMPMGDAIDSFVMFG